MRAKHCTFRNAIVHLDGHSYRSCRFERCRLVYAGGELPSMIDCTFEGCSWRLAGAAARTLRLMRAMVGHGGATRAQVARSLSLTTPPSDVASRLTDFPATRAPDRTLH
jgi:hypothetical protein